jgi:hypothetical protein
MADAPVCNMRCPIMGTKIDPTKVPENLTREYKNKKVGFCCAGCLEAWDKLTDEEKDAKLKAAKEPEKPEAEKPAPPKMKKTKEST